MFFKTSLVLLVLTLVTQVRAQQDYSLYTLSSLQHTLYTNPANTVDGKIYIGIPAISSLYFNFTNNLATPKDLFENTPTGTRLRVNHLTNLWNQKNYVGASINVELLSFGFKIREKNYIHFTANENIFTRVTLPKDLLTFPFTGNGNFEETEGVLDFSNMGVDAFHYRSFGLGYQRKVNDKWTFGAKVKLLSGMNSVYTKSSTFKLTTDTTTYDLAVTGRYAMYTSGIDTTENAPMDAYYRNVNGNYGIALDLGASYNVTPKLNVSASVIDLGFINWKNGNINFESQDVDIAYTGIDFSSSLFSSDTTADPAGDHYTALGEEFENQVQTNGNTNSFTTSLITRFYVGANYTLIENPKLKGQAGALFFGELYRGTLRPSLTLSYTQNLTRKIQLTANYTLLDKRSNVGAGLVLGLGAFQIHAIVDNVLAVNTADLTSTVSEEDEFGNPTTSTQSITLPYSAKHFQARVGFNVAIGNREKNKREQAKEKVRKAKEREPQEVVNKVKKSDRDGDGIKNKEDKCPDDAGVLAFKGCPDSDGDGIQDSEDECPSLPGNHVNKGCPDTDGDGIIDKNDRCPDVIGLEEFEGCPDSDQDGVQDSEDACPNTAGLKVFNGCPDTDKDGIADPEDECVDVAGPKDNNGCPYPDTDGDGVLDKDDVCVKTPGVPENNGCPVVKEEVKKVIQTAFDNLEFETAKAVIKDASLSSLEALAQVLKENNEFNLKIEGHTDNVGSPENNLQLSKERAEAVKAYLMEQGVEEQRIETLFFGETQPIASNDTEEGRAQNRRVEMTLVFE
ncbi:Thrombospondin type 3 repeat-containing protein [Lishizhenia tianjinensis]|uniref:Thrombospondin type 3 repeat-containing protein n=1 Tax=Lishizhenia tianjinensis TaxID=477690 RepID=A0A1I7BQJ2_9FLAO|nr:Thrombospondin type 3 repeat-containing protein [Lishizhenia tianjinensis]